EHPLAAALVMAAEDRKLALADVHHFESLTGKGVIGEVDGKRIVVGNPTLFLEQQIDIEPLRVRIESLRADGQTAVVIAVVGKAAGLIGVADPVRATTPEAIRLLHEQGLRIIMLTGDSRTTAAAVARKLGIDEVIAEVLPQEKGAAIKRLQEQGHKV